MKITIKQLQGSECIVEVTPETSILEIKQQIKKKLNIPVTSQRLLLIGRALSDEQLVKSHPAIKEGTKLNLAVKKPDGLYEASYKVFRKKGMSDAQAAKAASRLLNVIKEKFEQLSWDDIQRLSLDFLLLRDGVSGLHINSPNAGEPKGL